MISSFTYNPNCFSAPSVSILKVCLNTSLGSLIAFAFMIYPNIYSDFLGFFISISVSSFNLLIISSSINLAFLSKLVDVFKIESNSFFNYSFS